MSRVGLLVTLCGCRQLLGFESASPSAGDATIDVAGDQAVDSTIDTPDDAAAVTLTFRQGADGYSGSRDTFIAQGDVSENSTDINVRWRSTDRFGLIAFDDLFGGAIPEGATIVEAHLEVTINNPGSEGMMFESVTVWANTVVFDAFGATPGVDAEDLGDLVGAAPSTSGVNTVVVTDSLAKWSTTPAANQGWIFIGGDGGGDTTFRSSEDGELSNRPRLSVTYRP